MLRINLTGASLACKNVVPLIKKQKSRRIVNIASHAARDRTGTGKAQYAASKAEIIGSSRVLADEVGGDGPGAIGSVSDTPHRLGRLLVSKLGGTRRATPFPAYEAPPPPDMK